MADNFASYRQHNYFMDEEFRSAALGNLEYADRHAVEEKLDSNFTGSCFGIALTSLLIYDGTIGIGELTEQKADTVSAIQLEETIKSIINWYHVLQHTYEMQNVLVQFSKKTKEKEKINQLAEALKEGNPVLLAYYGKINDEPKIKGHAVIAYHIEPVNDFLGYDSNKKDLYKWRVDLYDCNMNEHNVMYLNTEQDNERWCIPSSRIYSNYRGSQATLGIITDNSAFLNHYGCVGSKDSAAASEYFKKIVSYVQTEIHIPDCDSFSMNKIDSEGDITIDYSEEEMIEIIPLFGEGDEEDIIRYAMRDVNSGYSISTGKAKGYEMRIAMRYEDRLLEAECTNGSEASFMPDGKIALKMVGECEYRIHMTSNSSCLNTDWYEFEVKGKSGDNITVQPRENGWILSGSSLENISVKAKNEDSTVTGRFTTGYNSAYVYEIDKETIGIKADTDGDGIYETEITEEELEKGDVTGDGNVSADDAQEVLEEYVAITLSGLKGKLTAAQRKAADINADGIIGGDDAQNILQYYVRTLSGEKITWEEILRE